jgi:hypothetical protein
VPLQTYLDDVLQTQDGPWECYDAVVTASDIAELYRTGFLRIDPEKQRGIDPVSGKQVIDQKKIETWTDELIHQDAIFGELSWNLRRPESEIEYDRDGKRLRILRGGATIPDSWHRHKAVLQAHDSAARGSGFDVLRRFSVRIYHVTAEDEARIFYALNQEGKPADSTRSKWLYPKEIPQKIARELVEKSPYLTADNVDTVRDRLSRRNPRLAAFNTFAKAMESAWSDVSVTATDHVVPWLVGFWDKLVGVLPELKKLDIAARRTVRERSLADSGVAIHGYIRLARRMHDTGAALSNLERLAEPLELDGATVPFFSRSNPEWARRGILIPSTRKDGSVELTLRNARQSFDAMSDVLIEKVGLGGKPRESAAEAAPQDEDALSSRVPAGSEESADDHEETDASIERIEAERDLAMPSLAWRDEAIAVLRENSAPMHYRELYGAIAARGLTFGGRSPEATFLASLSREQDAFVGVGKGSYWIAGEPMRPGGQVSGPRRRTRRPKPIGARRPS